MIAGVGDVDVIGGVHIHAGGAIQFGGGAHHAGGAGVAVITCYAVSYLGDGVIGSSDDGANAIVELVSDVEVLRVAEDYVHGSIHHHLIAGAAVTDGVCGRGADRRGSAASWIKLASIGGNISVVIDHANDIVVGVCDVDKPGSIDDHSHGAIELSTGGGPAIAGEAGGPGACNCGDDSRGIDLKNFVGFRIGDVVIAKSIYGDARGAKQLRAGGGTADAPGASACESGDDSWAKGGHGPAACAVQ